MITTVDVEQVNYNLCTSFRWNWTAVEAVRDLPLVFVNLKLTNTWTQDTVLNENLKACVDLDLLYSLYLVRKLGLCMINKEWV